MKNIIICSFLCLQSISSCNAVEKTSDIYFWCSEFLRISNSSQNMTAKNIYNAGLCDGYFAGFSDGEYLQYIVDSIRNGRKSTGAQLDSEFHSSTAWCEPKKGISKEQKVRMFNRYVEQHPESMHKDAYLTLMKAMKPHFPCAK